MAHRFKFNFTRQSLVGASMVTFIAYIISAGFGYLREAATANYFGTTSDLDIFILAFTIPELIVVIVMSCLPTALIPSLKKVISGSGAEESEYFWSGLVSFGSLLLVLATAFYIFKIEILTGIFSLTESTDIEMGSRLSNLFVAYIVFRGLEFYFRGWLFEKKHFVVPVTMGIIQNLIIILSIIFLHERYFVESLAFGWVLSSAALFIYNGAAVFWIIRPKLIFKLHKNWLKEFYRSLGIIAVIELVSLIYPLIDRHLASKYLDDGYISALKYAFGIILLPNRMFAISVSSVSFPFITDLYKCGNQEKLRKIYLDSICLLFFIMGFIGVGFAVFAEDVLRLIFQRGLFNEGSLQLTAGPLFIFALGIVFNSMYIFQMRFYFARSSYLFLALVRVSMLVIKVIFSLILITNFQHSGLAAASVIAWFTGFVIMGFDLGKSMKLNFSVMIRDYMAKSFAALAVVAVVWITGDYIWQSYFVFEGQVAKLFILGGTGALVYFLIAFRFKFHEIDVLKSLFLKTLGNRENEG